MRYLFYIGLRVLLLSAVLVSSVFGLDVWSSYKQTQDLYSGVDLMTNNIKIAEANMILFKNSAGLGDDYKTSCIDNTETDTLNKTNFAFTCRIATCTEGEEFTDFTCSGLFPYSECDQIEDGDGVIIDFGEFPPNPPTCM